MKVNKRFRFRLSIEPEDFIVYDASKKEAVDRVLKLINPLWDMGAGITVQCLGETKEHDCYVSSLIGDYTCLMKYPEVSGELDPDYIESELRKRNVWKGGQGCRTS